MIHYVIFFHHYTLFLTFNTNMQVSGQDFQPIWSSSIWQTWCLMEPEIKAAFLVIFYFAKPISDERLFCWCAAAEPERIKFSSATSMSTEVLRCEVKVHGEVSRN